MERTATLACVTGPGGRFARGSVDPPPPGSGVGEAMTMGPLVVTATSRAINSSELPALKIQKLYTAFGVVLLKVSRFGLVTPSARARTVHWPAWRFGNPGQRPSVQ